MHKRIKMQTKQKLIISVEIFIVLLLKIYSGDAARGHKLSLQFQRVECRIYNKEFVESLNCTLRGNDVTKELLLNIDLILAKDANDFKVRSKVVFEINDNSAKFFDEEVDICKSFANRFDFRLLRVVSDEVHIRSNIPLKCPLSANVHYHMRNFTINSKYLPQFFPESKWSSYFNFSIAKSISMGLNAFGTFKRNKM